MNDTALLDELVQLVVQRIGLRIPDDMRERFIRILRERAAHLGYTSLNDYQTSLIGRQATEEWEELVRVFTSGETFFFRDHGQFDLLRLHLLPELIAHQCSAKTLCLWSAGCSSGEEAYSLAILVDMLLPKRVDWNILILGTDIDSAAIAKAQRGRFGQWSFRMVPEEIRQRYFHLEDNEWILDERIRRMVTFRIANLVSEPFPDLDSGLHNMDLIMCRNVFIYFDPAAVSSVAAKFAATLRAEGYLLTAHTELIGYPMRELETRLLAEGVVYRRRGRVSVESGYPPQRFHPAPKSKADKSTLKKVIIPPGIQPNYFVPESRKTVADISNKLEVRLSPPPMGETRAVHTPISSTIVEQDLLKEARANADRGNFDLAEHMCHKALDVDPLVAAAYYLLAQLAQIKGGSNHAKECLNKAIYLAPRFVAAYLELAAICEREDDFKRALTLRRAALGIVRTLPDNERIELCETTAGELTQWLAQL